MILFWPALFFLDGKNSPQATEYARLKGERDTLERVAIAKECGIDIRERPIKPKETREPVKDTG